MRKYWTTVLAFSLALQTGFAAAASAAALASDHTTKYRVYQNDKAIREFSTDTGAIAYAKNFTYTHVEKITGRLWVWDNFPRYKVYENGFSTSGREFRTLQEAKQFAGKLKFAQIRDLEKPGFVASTYPAYQLFQGDKTLPAWSFATLAEAKKAAKAYSNVHIIELSTNQWIWDNLTVYQKNQLRQGTAKYDIWQDGIPTGTLVILSCLMRYALPPRLLAVQSLM